MRDDQWNDLPSSADPHLETAPAVSVADISRALQDDSDWLTIDEIAYAPIELVERQLAEQGLEPIGVDEEALATLFRESAATRCGSAVRAPAAPAVIFRPHLVKSLHQAILAHGQILLKAPAGSGKTHFVRQEYLRDRQVRKDLARTLVIDCTALRVMNPFVFGREAVWAYFGSDDDGFKAFLKALPQDEEGNPVNPLMALAEQRLRSGDILVFDHTDALDRSGAMDAWLCKFLKQIRQKGAKALFVERAPQAQSRPAFRELGEWCLPDFQVHDIVPWLAQSRHRRSPDRSLNARAVVRTTGGRPGLLRDFALFLRDNPDLPLALSLHRFRRWRTRQHQFFADCSRLVRAARRHPDVVARALSPGALGEPWNPAGLGAEAIVDLLATGAVRFDAGGRLSLASPLYARRLALLLDGKALARVLLRTDFRGLNSTSSKALKHLGELAADPLAKSLSYETNPIVGLQRFAAFIARWDFEARIYLRDQDNARLWAPFDRPEKIGPLECWRQPDFARAAQTGQLVKADDGRVLVPVVSNSGVTGMVVVLEFRKVVPRPGQQQIDIDRVADLLHGVSATLAQFMQRVAVSRERRFQGKLWFKSKSPELQAGRLGLLREVGCRSIIVFEKLALTGQWVAARFERTGPGGDGMRWIDDFNAVRLESIVHHPSKRGLVLSGEHAAEVFPRLAGRKAAVFLHPIVRQDEAIVVFLFEGPGVPLDGNVQAKLSRVAPDLVSAAAA